MGFVSGNHILLFVIFLVIVLVIFGPGKLPDVGSGMGRAI
ncbi:MAG TPA: twin-arginine translocase TatA/TatE family subunit, partial [Candidatus Dormibacteraeota bacterium]|nr:twin-arginine translocase TatA/TatE family subunit [Candidatus Dormibacteraeota bacterium]